MQKDSVNAFHCYVERLNDTNLLFLIKKVGSAPKKRCFWPGVWPAVPLKLGDCICTVVWSPYEP